MLHTSPGNQLQASYRPATGWSDHMVLNFTMVFLQVDRCADHSVGQLQRCLVHGPTPQMSRGTSTPCAEPQVSIAVPPAHSEVGSMPGHGIVLILRVIMTWGCSRCHQAYQASCVGPGVWDLGRAHTSKAWRHAQSAVRDVIWECCSPSKTSIVAMSVAQAPQHVYVEAIRLILRHSMSRDSFIVYWLWLADKFECVLWQCRSTSMCCSGLYCRRRSKLGQPQDHCNASFNNNQYSVMDRRICTDAADAGGHPPAAFRWYVGYEGAKDNNLTNGDGGKPDR